MNIKGSWSCINCEDEECNTIWTSNDLPCPDIKHTTNDDRIKDKSHKAPMHLILWKPVRWLIRIRLYGLSKYPDAENYKGVDPIDWYDACLRHLAKWSEGEQFDAESGLPHLAHALCNLCYLIEITENESDF